MASNTFTGYQDRFAHFCRQFGETVHDVSILDSSKSAVRSFASIDPNNLDGVAQTSSSTNFRNPG